MKKALLGFQCLVFILFFVSASRVHGSTALQTIETKVNAVVDVLSDPALKGDAEKETREKKLWAIADTMFDYPTLSQRTLGKDWEKLNAEQQKQFTDLFSTHLGNVYMDRLLEYSDEKVVFDRERKKEARAIVYTKVVTSTKEIPIDYSMILKDGDWKVYDVVIEGVSLVRNYRSQFKEMLKNKAPEYLLDALRKKVDERA
jgi:phospholipid transport system substrate-binding protein